MSTHFDKLKQLFHLKWRRVPHFSALRKILIQINPTDIESAFREFSMAHVESEPSTIRQICFDGKALNGLMRKIRGHFMYFRLLQIVATSSSLIVVLMTKRMRLKRFMIFY